MIPAASAATIDESIEAIQREIKAQSDALSTNKKRRDGLVDDALEKSRIVRHGTRDQNVECEELEETLDGRRLAVTYRLDTGEEISRRELTASERQGKLFDKPVAEVDDEPEARAQTASLAVETEEEDADESGDGDDPEANYDEFDDDEMHPEEESNEEEEPEEL